MTDVDWARIRCVVFDYGDTLSSDHYFKALGPDFDALVGREIFEDNTPEWCDLWIRGELTAEMVADHLAGLSGLSSTWILEGLVAGCARLTLHPVIWQFAQAQRALGRNTALVTLNFDVFSRLIVPAMGFDRVFDVIVNSADHRHDDKVALWQYAFRRLDGCDFANSLLIDDKAKHVDRFRARGGMAYQYTGDEEFAQWLKGGGG